MAQSSAKRSQLIDYTYNEVCSLVSGRREGTRPEQIVDILEARVERLQRISEPFQKPSDASKKRIESGSVTLPDGVSVTVDPVYKPIVYAISDHFDIDQIDALVLLRSFLYNEHYPDMFNGSSSLNKDDTKDGDKDSTEKSAYDAIITEVLDRIRPFYYAERLNVARTLVALIKCRQDANDPLCTGAQGIFDKIIKNAPAFTMTIMKELTRKSRLPLPEATATDPRAASSWAKQNAREQLVLAEALFWMLWAEVEYEPPLVEEVFMTAYETDFGYGQENAPFMLDEEGMQLQRDLAALWILITIEVLDLESVPKKITSFPPEKSNKLLHASPLSLLKIHRIVISHTAPGYVCTMLAWALYLRAISEVASSTAERPQYIVPFLKEIRSSTEVALKKGEKELHASLIDACLRPESGLFPFITSLLTDSPVFVASAASKLGSAVTNPDEVAYRALIKGLVMALVDAKDVELIPDFDGLVETWIALFGSRESANNAGLRRQFWEMDWNMGSLRRAIFDTARSRFPVQFRPLVRLLRAMAGGMHSEGTDPILSSVHEDPIEGESHRVCSSYAFLYFQELPTYTQVIPASARTGVNNVYDRVLERAGSSSVGGGGVAYTNLRPVNLPGGSILPAKSIGRLLCADSSTEPVVVAWQHPHSGWNVMMDVLIDYTNRRSLYRAMNRHSDGPYGRRSDVPVVLQVDDIGFERDGEDETMVAEALELILSIIQGNYAQTQEVADILVNGPRPVSYTGKDDTPPDLVQLIFLILEDALSRSNRLNTPSALVTPALGVLAALLSLPRYSHGIWLYLRRTAVLFGSEREPNFNSAILSAERASGHYNMTLALLRLLRTLFEEAIASLIETQADVPEVQVMKEDVLLRAMQFVHGQIWMEHSGWRYAHLANRFEIGRSIAALYARVIETSSAVASAHTFASLSRFVTDIMIHQATTSSIMPLVHTIASGRSIYEALETRRRFYEARQYTKLLKDSLRLVRLVLYLKSSSSASSRLILLEQALCSDHSAGNVLSQSKPGRVNTVDMMAHYIKQRELGSQIPIEAIRALTALTTSVSGCTPSPPSLIGCFANAQATVKAFVKILRHPYDDLALRNAIWTFVSVAVERQPALAVLFVAGQFRVEGGVKGKEKRGILKEGNNSGSGGDGAKIACAVDAACEALTGWHELWEANPQLLASVMHFLDVVWTRSFDHLATLAPTKGDTGFWNHISAIVKEELGPAPDYTASKTVEGEEGVSSDLHEAVSAYACRIRIKAHALRIIGSDVAIQARSGASAKAPPASLKEVQTLFQSEDSASDALLEAASTSYDPSLYDELVDMLKTSYAPLTLESLQSPEPLDERDFGDNFMLSVPLLQDVLRSVPNGASDKALLLLYSVNLNMSLANPQLALVNAWSFFLQQARGFIRGDPKTRAVLLASAAAVARDIAMEKRTGDFMCTVHGGRLRMLLALLEAAWFSQADNKAQMSSLMALLESVDNIISNEQFPPEKSFLGTISSPFHRSLLQIIYFCATDCQRLGRTAQNVRAEHRLLMGKTFTSSLTLVADALRLTFDAARTRFDLDLDKDMELLVTVFQQCTRPGLHTSAQVWMTKCQEADVIKASLELLTQTDMAGVMDLDLLRTRKQPLYAPHVLTFHLALVSLPPTAERLASENMIPAYCNNSISVALSEGVVDVSLPELPGERSPAHKAYCSMLLNITGIMANLTSPRQFIESHVVGFVQLYGAQLSRMLSWNNDIAITLPLIEELELTVELFHMIACGATSSSNSSLTPVFRAFSEHALLLIQQLNYALTHPKHLSSLLEPATSEERLRLDREATENNTAGSLTQLCNAEKRPIMTSVVRRLFSVSASVLSTLVVLGGGETVLLSDPEEWPIREAHLVPHSKVTISEPASIGTLLELGNCALEVLEFLANKKLSPSPPDIAAANIKSQIRSCRQLLESLLLYASTQLAMWVAKQDGEQPGEMEVDDTQQQQSEGGYKPESNTNAGKGDRRIRRKSLSLADRLRRGMTGEMTNDLESLVTKAKPVMAKSSEVLGKPEPVDLLPALAKFLEERVVAS